MDTDHIIRSILAEIARKPVTVAPEEPLFGSGLLDSFAIVDLVAGLEDAFALKIPDSDLSPRRLSSIKKIQEYLEERGIR